MRPLLLTHPHIHTTIPPALRSHRSPCLTIVPRRVVDTILAVPVVAPAPEAFLILTHGKEPPVARLGSGKF